MGEQTPPTAQFGEILCKERFRHLKRFPSIVSMVHASKIPYSPTIILSNLHHPQAFIITFFLVSCIMHQLHHFFFLSLISSHLGRSLPPFLRSSLTYLASALLHLFQFTVVPVTMETCQHVVFSSDEPRRWRRKGTRWWRLACV